jgi:hypothetical protein
VKTDARAVIRALRSFRASRAGAVIAVFLAFPVLGGVAQGQTPGTGTVTIGPPGTQYLLGAGPDGSNIYDSGSVSITVNGYTNTMTYGGGYEAIITFVQEMVFNINDLNPYVTASVLGSPNDEAGGQILLTARTSGSNTNYSLSVANSWDTTDFAYPSFPATVSGPSLTGGANGPVLHLVFQVTGAGSVGFNQVFVHPIGERTRSLGVREKASFFRKGDSGRTGGACGGLSANDSIESLQSVRPALTILSLCEVRVPVRKPV